MKTIVKNTPNMSKAQVRNSEATFFMSGATQHNQEILDLLLLSRTLLNYMKYMVKKMEKLLRVTVVTLFT